MRRREVRSCSAGILAGSFLVDRGKLKTFFSETKPNESGHGSGTIYCNQVCNDKTHTSKHLASFCKTKPNARVEPENRSWAVRNVRLTINLGFGIKNMFFRNAKRGTRKIEVRRQKSEAANDANSAKVGREMRWCPGFSRSARNPNRLKAELRTSTSATTLNTQPSLPP